MCGRIFAATDACTALSATRGIAACAAKFKYVASSIGNHSFFQSLDCIVISGRHFAAWMGLAPREQCASPVSRGCGPVVHVPAVTTPPGECYRPCLPRWHESLLELPQVHSCERCDPIRVREWNSPCAMPE